MIGETKLAEWERIADKATEGPWYRCLLSICTLDLDACCQNEVVSGTCGDNVVSSLNESNLDFIASAREAVPELIAEVRRLEKEAEYLAGCIEWCPDDVPQGACYDICSNNGDEFVPKEKCVQCWRERARKETETKS